MSPLRLRCAFAALLLISPTLFANGCLDARRGGVGEATPDEAQGAGPLAGDCRVGAAPALGPVSWRVGAWDISPCGHLAWVDESASDPVVVLRAPHGAELARYSPDGGWFGAPRFGPPHTADALMVFETFRSDLGFGDWTVVDPAAPAAPVAVVDFPTSESHWGFSAAPGGAFFWHCAMAHYGGESGQLGVVDRDGAAILAESAHCDSVVVRGAVVVALVAAPEPRLRWWDVGSGESGTVGGEAHGDWSYGDTVRWRDELAVSADGALIAVQWVNESYISGFPPLSPAVGDLEVYLRGGDGVPLVLSGAVRGAVLPERGATMLFADPEGTGVTWVRRDGDGVVAGFADAVSAPLHVFADGAEALVKSADGTLAALSLTDGAVGELAAGAAGPFVVAPDEATVVFGAADGEAWRLVRWERASGVVETVVGGLPALPTPRWLGTDGATLLDLPREVSAPGGSTGGGGATRSVPTLLGPDGRPWWQVEASFESVTPVGDLLAVATHAANDDLVVLDPASGRVTAVVSGHDFDVRAAADGRSLAFRYTGLSATSWHLWAGRTPVP